MVSRPDPARLDQAGHAQALEVVADERLADRPTWAMSSATLASPSARRRTMRSRFTSARALWKARSSRRSSGWRTIDAIVERKRAGVGTGGQDSGRAGGPRRRINEG